MPAHSSPTPTIEPSVRFKVSVGGRSVPASSWLPVEDCPSWFTQRWSDQFFDRVGTAALFDAIGATDKRLLAYPGLHLDLSGERLDDAFAFLVKRLATQATLFRNQPESRYQRDPLP